MTWMYISHPRCRRVHSSCCCAQKRQPFFVVFSRFCSPYSFTRCPQSPLSPHRCSLRRHLAAAQWDPDLANPSLSRSPSSPPSCPLCRSPSGASTASSHILGPMFGKRRMKRRRRPSIEYSAKSRMYGGREGHSRRRTAARRRPDGAPTALDGGPTLRRRPDGGPTAARSDGGPTADRRRPDGGPTAVRRRTDVFSAVGNAPGGPTAARRRPDGGPTAVRRRSDGGPTADRRIFRRRECPSRPPYV